MIRDTLCLILHSGSHGAINIRLYSCRVLTFKNPIILLNVSLIVAYLQAQTLCSRPELRGHNLVSHTFTRPNTVTFLVKAE